MLILGLASTETVDSSAPDLAEATVKKVSALQRFWNNINWDAIVATLIEKSLSILFLIFLFFIIQRIGKYLIDRTYANYSKKQHFSESRLKTLHTLIINAFQYTLFFFFIYSLLTIVGVPVGSLLAGAGIAGVAIGLGAQGFMNDLITGFFIILEQQMDVGDYIRLLALNIEGTVTSVGLRTTQIKAVDGTVHFIPNRNITTISNLSRANMQVLYRKYSNWARYFWYGRFRQWQLCGANDHVCTKRQTICGQRRISSSIYQSINRGRFYDSQYAHYCKIKNSHQIFISYLVAVFLIVQ